MLGKQHDNANIVNPRMIFNYSLGFALPNATMIDHFLTGIVGAVAALQMGLRPSILGHSVRHIGEQ